ncbi:MAG: 3-oxoadipate enol-lactonase [Chloroflexi bacterium]|nr:3-oxoadipate enol-lactonase [Chloroflexota bacterium]
MQFLQHGGLTLAYRLDGRVDGPPIIFVNSLGSDYRIWDAVTVHLADDYYCIRYDKRGHGLSDSPPAPYRIDEHSADLAGLLDALDVPQAVVIGISVGGLIAMDFTLRHTQRVSALVLCDTVARLGTAELWQTRIDDLRERGVATMASEILPRWFAPGFAEAHPAEYHGYLNMLARMPLEGYIGTCAALRDADLRESVPGITARTLVLCGAQDEATPPDEVQTVADAIPQARFELIEGAGHLPCIEAPEAFSQAIAGFLQGDRHEQA